MFYCVALRCIFFLEVVVAVCARRVYVKSLVTECVDNVMEILHMKKKQKQAPCSYD